jgi:hypothetical protein
VDLTFKGQPLDPAKKLRVATNNYRLNGGGGYVMFKDCPVVVRSSTEIRDLIIDWVERNGAIPAEPRGIGGSCRRERKGGVRLPFKAPLPWSWVARSERNAAG